MFLIELSTNQKPGFWTDLLKRFYERTVTDVYTIVSFSHGNVKIKIINNSYAKNQFYNVILSLKNVPVRGPWMLTYFSLA